MQTANNGSLNSQNIVAYGRTFSYLHHTFKRMERQQNLYSLDHIYHENCRTYLWPHHVLYSINQFL
jgi:hypothetical protein